MNRILNVVIYMAIISLVNCSPSDNNPDNDPDCGKEIDYVSKDFRDFSYIIDFIPKEIVLIEKYKDSTFTDKLSDGYEKLIGFGSDGAENYSFSLDYQIDSRFSYRFYFADTNNIIYKYDLSAMRFQLVCLALGEKGSGTATMVKTKALVSYDLNGKLNADPAWSSIEVFFNEVEKNRVDMNDSVLFNASKVTSSQWESDSK